MEIYNNKDKNKNSNGRPKRTCSYCSDPDHVVTDCHNAINDWAYFNRYEIPLRDNPNKHWTKGARIGYNGAVYDHWYRSPSEWGRWFVDCEKAIKKIEKAKAKQAKNKGKRKAQSKCGFCGEKDHNRRDCKAMEQFKRDLLQANRAWRQRLHDHLVNNLGISEGAVVKVIVPQGYQQPEKECVGIVKSVNWEELSMFCVTETSSSPYGRLREDFRQALKVFVKVDGETRPLRFFSGRQTRWNSRKSELLDEHGVLCDFFTHHRCVEYVETIAKSKDPLSQDWIAQGHEDAMDFLVKKYSSEKLMVWKVHDLLKLVQEGNKKQKLSQNA